MSSWVPGQMSRYQPSGDSGAEQQQHGGGHSGGCWGPRAMVSLRTGKLGLGEPVSMKWLHFERPQVETQFKKQFWYQWMHSLRSLEERAILSTGKPLHLSFLRCPEGYAEYLRAKFWEYLDFLLTLGPTLISKSFIEILIWRFHRHFRFNNVEYLAYYLSPQMCSSISSVYLHSYPNHTWSMLNMEHEKLC